MKQGDKFPINLDQWTVAEAVVVDVEDGQVTLDIPATRIVMGVKTSLSDLEPAQPSGTEHQLLGDDSDNSVPAPAPQSEQVRAAESNAPQQSSTTELSSDSDVLYDSAAQQRAEQEAEAAKPPVQSTTLRPDDVGEGLANVKLPEMD